MAKARMAVGRILPAVADIDAEALELEELARCQSVRTMPRLVMTSPSRCRSLAM